MPKAVRVLDRYEIVRKLASGGMGDIFLARQIGVAGFERLVVLKSMRPNVAQDDRFFSRFLNEARTAARLNHPHVVQVLEIDEFRGVYFIAMEYIEGADLARLARAAHRAKQRLPFRVLGAVMAQAARGLAHAHRARGPDGAPLGIVHRDVSPQNVMVRLDGITKVVDFGIAHAAGLVDLDGPKVRIGKLRYMSPEQIRGAPLDARSDQFSLGVVFWEMLLRRKLFAHPDAVEILHTIASGLPAPRTLDESVPAALADVVMQMLASSPDNRFDSLDDAAEVVERWVETGPTSAQSVVARVVDAFVGAEVRSTTTNLTPEEVSISGLQEDVGRLCPGCGRAASPRASFCAACGHPLDGRRPAARAPKAPAPSGERHVDDALRALLDDSEASLDGALTRERRTVQVVVARPNFDDERPDDLRRRERSALLERWSSLARGVTGEVATLNEDRLTVVFGARESHPNDTDRALDFAHAVVAAAPSDGEVCAVLDEQEIVVTTNQPVADVFDLLHAIAGAGVPGVLVGPTVADRLGLSDRPPIRLWTDDGRACAVWRAADRGGGRPACPSFVARRSERLAAAQLLAKTAARRGGGLVFTGVAGVGKTRLLEVIAAQTERADVLPIVVDVATLVGRGPRALALEALRATTAALDIPWTKLDVLGVPRGAVGRVVTALEYPSAVSSAARLDDALAQALHAAATVRPVVLLVDDLDALPSATAAWLDQWLLDGASAISVIATMNAGGGHRPPASWTTVALGPLDDRAMLTVARAAADGLPLPPAAAQLVLERAAGSPSLARLVVRTLIEQRGLERQRLGDDVRWVATPLLSSVRLGADFETLLATRLDRLPNGARDLLRVGAVLGRVFDAAIAHRAAGGDAADLEALVTASVEAGFVMGVAEGRQLSFSQGSYRDVLLRRFAADDLCTVRRRLGQLLAEGDGDPVDAALLWLAGGGGWPAIEWAASTIGAAPPTVARSMARLACDVLDALPRDRSRREVVLRLAAETMRSVCRVDITEAARLGDRLLEGVDVDGAPGADALLERALLLTTLGHLDRARADLGLARTMASPQHAARLAEAAGRIAEAGGDLDRAIRETLRRVEIERAQGTVTTKALVALGRLHFALGELDRADQLFAAAEGQAEADADRLDGLTNRAAVAGRRKDFPRALKILEEAARIAEHEGDRMAIARVAYNTARTHAALGDRVAAARAVTAALAAARAVRWTEGEAHAIQLDDELRSSGE